MNRPSLRSTALPGLLAFCLLLCWPAATAHAWGATGHRLIGRAAAQMLPAEIPAFLRTPQSIDQLGELAREADRSKGAGASHDADRNPGHYVNLTDAQTVVGGLPLSPLPPSRQAYDTALRARGWNEYQVGFLPYSVIDGWQQLRRDFAVWRADAAGERNAPLPEHRAWFKNDRQLREMLIVRDLGYWSHFVGDASQPLHVSIHFNGWGDTPNPHGYSTATDLHAKVEGAFVRKFVQPRDIAAKVPAYEDCRCSIEERTVAYLLDTQSHVVELYELEKQGEFDRGGTPAREFITARLAAAATQLRDMVVDAWRASASETVGFPPVPVRDVEAGHADPIERLKGLD